MATSFEDLKVLQLASTIADDIWKHVIAWEPFAREVVGGQLARATDSIGANIAEAFGRFHYGEKLQFLYYARGSLFETKYWLNRAGMRNLLSPDRSRDFGVRLTDLARQLNAFASSLKAQRVSYTTESRMRRVQEDIVAYLPDVVGESLFSEDDLQWLLTLPSVDR